MSTTLILLRVIHVSTAAVWFAVPLGVASMLKRGLEAGGDHFKVAVGEANRRTTISAGAGAATLVTGLLLIFAFGGFTAVGPPIHAALGLVLLMLVGEASVAKPTCAALMAVAEKPAGAEASTEARALIKRYAMFGGIIQLLWVVVLALMFVSPL